VDISSKVIAVGVAAGAGIVQLIWLQEPPIYTRVLAALPFLSVAIGVYSGRKWWTILALFEMFMLSVLLVGSALPDVDAPPSERINATFAFLETRVILIMAYSLGMLWAISIHLRASYSKDRPAS
jgi:hypothetical protein